MSDESSEAFQWTKEEEAKQWIPQTESKPKKKYLPWQLIYVLGALTILGILFWAFRPSPILVDVAQVKRSDVVVTVDEEGETRIRKRYLVSAPVEGRLARIDLEEGDRVTKGEIIAQIDPLPLESDIREAQARLRQWQAEKAGVATLRPKPEAISQGEARIRAVVAEQKEAVARVEQARAELEQAIRDRERNQKLYVDGVVSRQAKERAELEEITKIRALEAEQRLADSIAAQVNVAQEALLILRAETKRSRLSPRCL